MPSANFSVAIAFLHILIRNVFSSNGTGDFISLHESAALATESIVGKSSVEVFSCSKNFGPIVNRSRTKCCYLIFAPEGCSHNNGVIVILFVVVVYSSY